MVIAGTLLALGASAAGAASDTRSPCEIPVTSAADAGPGSLREAIARAAAGPGHCTIRFDSARGPFADPQTITLASDLPPLIGDLTIDGTIEGRLWVATGVTVSGARARRVFRVAPGARAVLSALTVADGRAEDGGGVLNEGTLVVRGVTFLRNVATRSGGAVAARAGAFTAVNCTFAENTAGSEGGGLAHLAGPATIPNCTFSGNRAKDGGGVSSAAPLLLRNTIVANSAGADCVARAGLSPGSTHNLIVANAGCGTPAIAADPRLGTLALYNGPTPTFPLEGDSPGINMGDNAAAVDEDGRPLVWDQRGNGDPRVVAGFTDLGAFEVQAFPVLKVNTTADASIRPCTGTGTANCSLRGAIELANAGGRPAVITFDLRALPGEPVITLTQPLPEAAVDLTLDAGPKGGVVVRGADPALRAAAGRRLSLVGVRLEPLR